MSWRLRRALAARMVGVAVLALACNAGDGHAQLGGSLPEVRAFAGSYLPAGKHHDLLGSAIAVGAQFALDLDRGAHAVMGFTWIPTELRAAGGGRIEMAQFDLGAEWLAPGGLTFGSRLSPLIGAGVGLRAYRSRDADTPSQANLGAFGAIGVEARFARLGVRLEGRDYLTAFRGLDGAAGTSMRSDATVSLGFAYHVQ